MSMTEWARREIEIACERERRLSEKEDDWDYGVACYESAYKAFKSLMMIIIVALVLVSPDTFLIG